MEPEELKEYYEELIEEIDNKRRETEEDLYEKSKETDKLKLLVKEKDIKLAEREYLIKKLEEDADRQVRSASDFAFVSTLIATCIALAVWLRFDTDLFVFNSDAHFWFNFLWGIISLFSVCLFFAASYFLIFIATVGAAFLKQQIDERDMPMWLKISVYVFATILIAFLCYLFFAKKL